MSATPAFELAEAYRTVFTSLREGVVIHDAGGRIVAVNPYAEALLGVTASEVDGVSIADPRWSALRPDGSPWPAEEQPVPLVLATGRPQLDVEIGVRTRSGELRWLRVNAVPLEEDGHRVGVVASFVDDTERVRDRERLGHAERLFSAAFADAPIGMALVSTEGAFIRVNRALCALTGWPEAELLARSFHEITHPDDLDADLVSVQRLLDGEIESYTMEKRYFTAAGGIVWSNLSVSLMRAPDGTPEYFIAQIEDISERKRMQEMLRRLADHDHLTELWNRRRFDEELERELARCRRYGGHAALLLFDLDHFKHVNDTLGHKAGDDLLRQVAAAVTERLRGTDALGRLGGDEFAALLPRTSRIQAAEVARAVADAVRSCRVRGDAGELSVTASVGVAHLDPQTPSAEAALHEADRAMYRAKAGRAAAGVAPPALD